MLNQRTVAKRVSFTGIGIHSGKKVNLTLHPAAADTGICFKRTDLRNSPVIKADVKLENLNKFNTNTLVSHLGISFTEVGPDYLCGIMPVDARTIQPLGLLHGGAHCVLAETLGSVGSNLCLNSETHYAVGLNIDARHIRSIRQGHVLGKATIIHKGKQTHCWDIKIIDSSNNTLLCVSKLSCMVMAK